MDINRINKIFGRIENLHKRFGIPVGGNQQDFKQILDKKESVLAVPADNKENAQDNINKTIEKVSDKYDINPKLLQAMIKTESNFDPYAVSRTGAKGLMQLMDGTSSSLGISDPFDIEENIDGGAQMMKMLLNKYKNDLPTALAAYNAGENAVEKAGGIPDYPETTRYIQKVMGEMQ